MDLITRTAWGARPPKNKPITIPTPVRDLYLHHSAGPDGGPQTVRSIQSFHQNSRLWNDIAYTWLYSAKDRVFYEGRGPGIAGAHTAGHNRTSHAVCVLGNFEATKPPGYVVDDLADWARWHGQKYGPDFYRPHNDVSATLCPGKHLAALIPQINDLATADEDDAPAPPPRMDAITISFLEDRIRPTFDSYEHWEDAVRRADFDA
jgi:hypothetical protein